jgi:hypothetical protein
MNAYAPSIRAFVFQKDTRDRKRSKPLYIPMDSTSPIEGGENQVVETRFFLLLWLVLSCTAFDMSTVPTGKYCFLLEPSVLSSRLFFAAGIFRLFSFTPRTIEQMTIADESMIGGSAGKTGRQTAGPPVEL